MKNFLYQVTVFLQKLFTSQSKHLHTARWAHDYELQSLSHETPKGLLIGIDRFGRTLSVEATEEKPDLGNLAIFGSTGTGKTTRELRQLRAWQGSLIVNDIKGDLSHETAAIRRKYGKVFFFAPSAGAGHRYDPLDGIYDERKLYSLAKHLLYVPDEKEPAFTERATKMLTQLFLAAKLIGERSLPFVARMVQLGGLNDVARELNAISPALAQKFLDAPYHPEKDYEENKYRISAWDSLSARLYPLLTDDIVTCFNGSDFTVRDLVFSTEPITIFLQFHESDLSALAPLIKFVWEAMFNELITAYDSAPDKDTCQRILVDIEEAGRTGIPNLPEHASTVRSRKISITAVFQDRSQAVSLYGPDRAKTLFNNFRTQIYYRQDDLDTAKYLEDRLGDKSGFAHSKTEHENGTSTGESEQRVPLLSAQYIMSEMPDFEIIGFHGGSLPFRAKGIPPLKKETEKASLKLPVLRERQQVEPAKVPDFPPLAEQLPDSPERSAERPQSWHFAPDLFRRWRPPPARNGVTNLRSENSEGCE